ncbi:hypothetical protein D3C85_1434270 [compost metagenome]
MAAASLGGTLKVSAVPSPMTGRASPEAGMARVSMAGETLRARAAQAGPSKAAPAAVWRKRRRSRMAWLRQGGVFILGRPADKKKAYMRM